MILRKKAKRERGTQGLCHIPGRISARRQALTIAAALALVGAWSATEAVPAQASESCTYPWCSEVYNSSPYNVTAARDWCNDSETYVGNSLPCDPGNPDGYSHYYDQLPSPGDHTLSHEDWDAFRVDAGCRYTFQYWSQIWGWSSTFTIDREAYSTGKWIRVHNDETAYIKSQVCA